MKPMTAIELKAVRVALRERLDALERITTVCAWCEHFAHAPRCAKHGADVPEDFSRTPDACDDWQFDGIPF